MFQLSSVSLFLEHFFFWMRSESLLLHSDGLSQMNNLELLFYFKFRSWETKCSIDLVLNGIKGLNHKLKFNSESKNCTDAEHHWNSIGPVNNKSEFILNTNSVRIAFFNWKINRLFFCFQIQSKERNRRGNKNLYLMHGHIMLIIFEIIEWGQLYFFIWNWSYILTQLN